jgi:hypothetical protein
MKLNLFKSGKVGTGKRGQKAMRAAKKAGIGNKNLESAKLSALKLGSKANKQTLQKRGGKNK